MNEKIRPYQNSDKDAIINIFRLNTPQYFALEEEKDLLYYLEHELEDYFVLEIEKQLVGCGGINYSEDKKITKISWDILHPDFQGQALGSKLLQHRIEKIKSIASIEKTLVRTSQMAFRFYEKNGFKLLEIQENYWAKGFDLYLMEFFKET